MPEALMNKSVQNRPTRGQVIHAPCAVKKLLPSFLSLFLPLFARSASAAAFSPLQIGFVNVVCDSGCHAIPFLRASF